MKSVDLLQRKKLSEDIQKLLELNFNDQRLINSALDADISCGFEAEVVWPSDDSYVSEQIEQLSWSEINYHLYRRTLDKIEQEFHQWIQNKSEYTDRVDQKLQDEIDSSYSLYLEDWFDLEYNDVELKDDETIQDYIDNNELEGEYKEWLAERVERDEIDRIREDALEELANEADYDMDEYIRDEWSTVMDFLGFFNIDPEDLGITVDDDVVMDNIGDILNSEMGLDVEIERSYGDITIDDSTTSWVVGPDSSIDADGGVGAEIKSYVYSSPRSMLEALESLYRILNKYGAYANRSTGLHVTMSWWKDENVPTNRLKMAVLMGDEYVLSQFNRLNNSYASSQYRNLYKAISAGMVPPANDIKEIENNLSKWVSIDKFRAIHFKNIENEEGNKLIEFRAAGGKYLDDFDKVSKIVSRYAIVMQAGHDPDFERESYVKALMRLLKAATDDVDAAEVQDTRIRSSVAPGTPAVYQGNSFTMGDDRKWKNAEGKSVRPNSRLDNILHNLSQSGDKLTKIKALNIPLKPLQALIPSVTNGETFRTTLIRMKNLLDSINSLVQQYPELKTDLSEADDEVDMDEIKYKIKDQMSRLTDDAYSIFIYILSSMMSNPKAITVDASTVRSLRTLYKIAKLTPEKLIQAYEGRIRPLDWIERNKIKAALSKLLKINIPLINVVEINLDTPSEPNTKLILETLHYISLLQDTNRKQQFIDLMEPIFPDIVNLLEIATFRDIQDMARTIILPEMIKAQDFERIKLIHSNLKRTGDFLKFDD